MAVLALWRQGGQPGRRAWRVADLPGPPHGLHTTLGAAKADDWALRRWVKGAPAWADPGAGGERWRDTGDPWNDPRTAMTLGNCELALSWGYNCGW